MSYWSHKSGMAGSSRPSPPPPPLPPRNNSHNSTATANVASPPPLPPRNNSHNSTPTTTSNVAPPLPPRPGDFGYQPDWNPRTSETSYQPTSPSIAIQGQQHALYSPDADGRVFISPATQDGRIVVLEQAQPHQYPSAQPSISPDQTRDYSDASSLFPGGTISPPAPMPAHHEVNINPPVPLLSETETSVSVSPGVFQPKITKNDGSQGPYSSANRYPITEQQHPYTPQYNVSRDQQPHTGGTQRFATQSNSQFVNNDPAGGAGTSQQVIHPTPANNDMATMNEKFQNMQLPSQRVAVTASTEGGHKIQYRAYTPQPPPKQSPAITENTPLPTEQSLDARSPTASAPTTSPRQSRIVGECMSSYVTFVATWYTHHQAPEYQICSNCYEDRIRGSRYEAVFKGTSRDDGKPRLCRFSTARMKEDLFKTALASGSLESVVQHMNFRLSIPDCVGHQGAKGDAGIKWYRPRNNAIPAMVVCQACYEDHVLVYHRFGEEHFEPNTQEHPSDQTWACDMPVPYIFREYKLRASTNDWAAFVEGAAVRLSLEPCPGLKTVYPSKRWFAPVNGPHGFLICLTCYCDYVLLTGLASGWQDAGDDLVNVFGVSVSCCLGHFNLKALAAQVLETGDHALFWKAVDVAAHEPLCEPKMKDVSMWYTLRSNPDGFEICRMCYVTLAESMRVGHHFVPKPDIVVPDSGIMCSFNPGIARFATYMSKLLQMVYTQDPAALEEFVRVYAFLPECRRATRLENALWYGWDMCTICPECHHEFVRGTALENSMAPQAVQVEGAVMCEMYSPRMRNLYLAACATDPPDPTPLLEYSTQRRAVWAATMPRVRQIIRDVNLNIGRQQMAMQNSTFYMASGNMWQNVLPLETRYGNSGLGYGRHNHMQIKGAEYAQQATAIGNEILGSPVHVADELERQWRAVE